MGWSRRAQSEALTEFWLIMCRIIHEVLPLPRSNAALVGHPTWSQGHIHTSTMLGRRISVVVIMSHVLGNALEWFPVRITQLHLVSCCTAVLDVLLY